MKAIVSTGYGAPEVLKVCSIEKPQPKANEVLVKVKASSITRADSMMRTGTPYIGRLFIGLSKPKQPVTGTGFSGVVESVGKEVSLYKKGDEVFGESIFNYGTNAEFTCVPELGVIALKPTKLSFNQAASICDGALTSINFLKELGNIQPNQKVLINGASGSLGTAAIQLAKFYGAHVTAVCSSRNTSLVNELGADVVIDYTKNDFTQSEEKFNIIFDTVGKLTFSECKKVLSPIGSFISPVLGFSLLKDVVMSSICSKKKAKFSATGTLGNKKLSELLQEIIDIIEVGKLVAVIDKTFKLDEIVQAHTYVESGRKKGNIVLISEP